MAQSKLLGGLRTASGQYALTLPARSEPATARALVSAPKLSRRPRGEEGASERAQTLCVELGPYAAAAREKNERGQTRTSRRWAGRAAPP